MTWSLTLLLACAPEAPPSACVDCALRDANNYSYTSELDIGALPVNERADTVVRWDHLTRDVRGDVFDPMAVEQARIIGFASLSAAEVTEALTHDAVDQADVGGYATCTPTGTSCALSDFGLLGNSVDIQQYMQDDGSTWLITLGSAGSLAVDAMAFLTPRPGIDATEVSITNETSRLDVRVELDALEPVVVRGGTSALHMDWSALDHDGLGDPLDHGTVDEVWVGRFTQTLPELEAQIFHLETLAAETWSMDVAGADDADLAELKGQRAVPGVDADWTWILALRCRACTNPAPRLITVLEAG